MGSGWTKPAISVAAAGLGAAVAGPLGGAIGGWMAGALGEPAAKLVEKYAEKFGEEAGKALLDTGKESLLERLKGEGPDIEQAYRDTLRASLGAVRGKDGGGYDDWFDDWDVCLKAEVKLNLEPLQRDELTADKLEGLLAKTLERLDGQGSAIRTKSQSIILKTRPLPKELFERLKKYLPELLGESFNALIVKPEYEIAWKQMEQQFRKDTDRLLGQIQEGVGEVRAAQIEDSKKLDAIYQAVLATAENEKRISAAEARALEAERLEQDWKQKYNELLASSQSSTQSLLMTGDLDTAAERMAAQIQNQTKDMARSYFELGTIQELRFDWPKAYAAYEQAWRLNRDPAYGFKYAYAAQHQNHFDEAIETYLELTEVWTGGDLAGVLHNLGLLYRDTEKVKEAEDSFGRSMAVFEELAKEDPEKYDPDLSATLNDRGIFYYKEGRFKSAEDDYLRTLKLRESMAAKNPDLYQPNVAETLNNLGILYHATERSDDSEKSYQEALRIRRELAAKKPRPYRETVAATLNNLGNLYTDVDRKDEAIAMFGDSLKIYRELAAENPDVYLPFVAGTLSNLADAEGDTDAKLEALARYGDSLEIYRGLLKTSPDAYLSRYALTLNNRGWLLIEMSRFPEALTDLKEALVIRKQLAESNPDANVPDVAQTMYNIARLYKMTSAWADAKDICLDAEKRLEPYGTGGALVYGNRLARIRLILAQAYEAEGDRATALEAGKRAMSTATDAGLMRSILEMLNVL